MILSQPELLILLLITSIALVGLQIWMVGVIKTLRTDMANYREDATKYATRESIHNLRDEVHTRLLGLEAKMQELWNRSQ